MSDTRTAMQVGSWLAPLIIIAGGFIIAKRANRVRAPAERVRWPIIVALLLAAIMVIQALSSNSSSAAAERQASPQSEVQVFKGENVPPWPTDITDESLIHQFGNTFADEAARRFKEASFPIGRDDILVNGEVFHRGEGKIVHISMHAGNKWFAQLFVGQVGRTQYVVECMQDGRPIDITASGCAARVKSVFGFEPSPPAGASKERG